MSKAIAYTDHDIDTTYCPTCASSRYGSDLSELGEVNGYDCDDVNDGERGDLTCADCGTVVWAAPVDPDHVACSNCAKRVHPLDVFPQGRCIDCHAADPAVRRELAAMTAGKLARMWGA